MACVRCYLCRRLTSGVGIVSLGVHLSCCVCVRRAVTARGISLGGEGNALYPVLSSLNCNNSQSRYLFTNYRNRIDIRTVARVRH